MMDHEKIEEILDDLPGAAADVPADIELAEYLRLLTAAQIHTNYLLAAILLALTGTRK